MFVFNSKPCWELLGLAASNLQADDFEEYFVLKRLSRQTDKSGREEFQRRFAKYYRLHIGGLTDEFKARYLELLVTWKPTNEQDLYGPLLRELYAYPRRKGDRVLHASFVSKLVAFHDEARPIYDSQVSGFFGLTVPSVGSLDFRIAGFVDNLHRIRGVYESWASNPRFTALQSSLIAKHACLETCHANRLCDFLVWSVGAKGLH